jgi:hypothetical protein
MKALAALLAIFVSSAAAQTVVTFDDGSTYTLTDNQQIYISTPNSALFKRRIFKNKNTYFIAQPPWSQRDYVQQPTDGLDVGSHEWCVAYVPWSEGYSFNMQAWQRYCDTNGDGVYDDQDEGWNG